MKLIMLAVIKFESELDTNKLPLLHKTVVEEIFNDFTDIHFPRENALAKLLRRSLNSEEIESVPMRDYPLQDCILLLAVNSKN